MIFNQKNFRDIFLAERFNFVTDFLMQNFIKMLFNKSGWKFFLYFKAPDIIAKQLLFVNINNLNINYYFPNT